MDRAATLVYLAREGDERADAAFDRAAGHATKGERFRRCVRAFRETAKHWEPAAPGRPGHWREPVARRLIPPLPGAGFGELAFDAAADAVRRIADFDDSVALAEPYPAARIVEQRRAAEAERDYLEHAAAETGQGCSPEEHNRQIAERSEIRAQSHEIARRLEAAGVKAYRDESLSLWSYWLHSRQWEVIPQFRRICFLPYVAAMVRAPKLAALEFFLSRHPFARFWTFTAGPRCRLEQLRETVQALHARLARLNSFLRKDWGVELVFRSTELGTLEGTRAKGAAAGADDEGGTIARDKDGAPLFHPHAHCVVISRCGYIPPERWRAMVAAVWRFWGNHWDAGKLIGNPRECCKYVTKPADLLKLSPVDLVKLHEALSGLKLVQPLGALRREIAARRDAGKTLRRYRSPEGAVWREVWDQNKHAALDAEERAAWDNLLDADLMEKETAAAAKAKPGEPVELPKKDVAWCRVFARLSPAIGPAGLKEPRVIVGGTVRCESTVTGHPLVQRLWSETVMEWEAGRAISVHTGTPTRAADFLADVPERARPPDPPIFADLATL